MNLTPLQAWIRKPTNVIGISSGIGIVAHTIAQAAAEIDERAVGPRQDRCRCCVEGTGCEFRAGDQAESVGHQLHIGRAAAGNAGKGFHRISSE